MPSLFYVVHKDLNYSLERTADFLAVERCISRAEAAAAFKRSPGFLLENAELGKASAFNLRASAFGFETLLLPQKRLKYPPPASVLSKIEFKDDGFNYFSTIVREHLPFETIKTITAGAFSVELPPKDEPEPKAGLINSLRARYFPFALPFGEKYNSQPLQPPAHPTVTVFMADIITCEPSPLRLTITCDDHDFSSLGAKKTLSSFENFRLLLEELSNRAAKAVRNPFLNALLEKKDLSALRYPSSAAYEKGLVWLLTILQ